jgi:hypothetical protein
MSARAACMLTSALLVLGTAESALAQQPKGDSSDDWKKTTDKMGEARKRYQLGLKLYEDGNYEAARIEFERAMTLAPSYKILYNIGLAYKQLNNYVDALHAFEEYLSQGGNEIPADRRADVQKEIAEIKPRIASVTVTSNVPGADVSIDDVQAGKTPLDKPLLVNPGVRKFSAQAKGYFPTTKTITVGSSEKASVVLDLNALPKETRLVERKSNPWTLPTVIGWSATGAAAIATTVFGVLALGAKSDQKTKDTTFGTSTDDRNAARDKTTTLATVTDVLGITTIVFAGVSAYFTIRLVGHTPEHQEINTGTAAARPSDLKADVVLGPTGLTAVGTF